MRRQRGLNARRQRPPPAASQRGLQTAAWMRMTHRWPHAAASQVSLPPSAAAAAAASAHRCPPAPSPLQEACWDDLHTPLLSAVLLRLLSPAGAADPLLQWPHALLPGTAEASAARWQQAAIAAFSLVCRAWRRAAHVALQQCTYCMTVQQLGLDTAGLALQLAQVTVSSLNLRLPTWGEEGGGAAAEAVLCSAGFRARSGLALRAALGVPERLVAALAAGFPRLEAVGLAEDYSSTDAKPYHSAPMHLAPLAALPRLERLQLELGIVELVALPAQVRHVQLTEMDRLMLPPSVVGASIADRLLAAVAAQGAWAGGSQAWARQCLRACGCRHACTRPRR